MTRGAMVDRTCPCGSTFQARTADVARGWGLYCGKVCKATYAPKPAPREPVQPLQQDGIRVCQNCRYADFPLTPTGKVRRNLAGRCTVPIPEYPLPWSLKADYYRSGIWPKDGLNCPTWAPITIHKQEKA